MGSKQSKLIQNTRKFPTRDIKPKPPADIASLKNISQEQIPEPKENEIKNENVILNLSKLEIKEFKQTFKPLQVKAKVDVNVSKEILDKYFEKM
jgi:hypothetical protein